MEYRKFSSFIEKVQYGFTAEETSSESGDAKYLRITDIVPYFVDKDRVPYCTISEEKKKQYIVKENDLLVARTGATTGYNLVVPKGFDNYIFASYLVRFFYDQDVLNPLYLKHVLKSRQYYGIIDRDFRADREIAALREDGIYTLGVAEVENLFVVPEVLEIMERLLGCDSGTADSAKQFITELFSNCKDRQIAEALSKEISHQLSLFELGGQQFTNEEIREKIENRFTVENIGAWRAEKEAIFNSANTLPEILLVFNFKELSRKISSKFSLSDRDFPKRVINVLTKNKAARAEIMSALSAYVPELPQ